LATDKTLLDFQFVIRIHLFGQPVGGYIKNQADGYTRIICLLCVTRFMKYRQIRNQYENFLEGGFKEHLISTHQDFLKNRSAKPEETDLTHLSKSDLSAIAFRNNK
jgi:four helix bundle suffix protein